MSVVGADIGGCLDALKKGEKVTRHGWIDGDMFIELQVPDANSKMTLPYIYMKTACGNLVPWIASQTDILAEDWYVV